MTDTTVVEVVLVDGGNYEKTLRLDNPKNGLTMTEIRDAFADVISEGWLLGRGGEPITSVARASTVQTIKRSLE